MTETFHCEDKERLTAYLYGELEPEDRTQVAWHLERCPACARELAGLDTVRRQLAAWEPPEADLGFVVVPRVAARPRAVWPAVPAWLQAAAAVLVLAGGAAIANVQIRQDASGWTITTGWMSAPGTPGAPAAAAAGLDLRWRAELAALESRLTDRWAAQLAAFEAGRDAPRAAAPDLDAEALLRRVRAIVADSERRQRQELALRLAQLSREIEIQRRADLVRIERGVGQIEGRTGAEVARQREMLNYLVRVAQRPQN